MNKDIDNMNERELLAELVRQGRRTERAEKIKICVLAALLLTVIVLALICIPKVLAPIRSISRSMPLCRNVRRGEFMWCCVRGEQKTRFCPMCGSWTLRERRRVDTLLR